MATIELNDDTLYTSALPAGARLFGATSAAASEPTSFGREAILNYIISGLATVASSGSASDLGTGTLPLGRLHGRLQDIANVGTWAQGDLIYFNGSNLVNLGPGTSGQYLKTQGAGANPVWATVSGGSGDVATDAIWNAKGDLAVGTGSDTASRLAVGTDGQILVADSSQATGVKWATASGTGDLLAANNLSDVASASTARSNLGLAIGTNVQAYDATLQSLSSLGTTADRVAYTTGTDTWAETTLTTFARSLLDDVDQSAARSTLGLVIGTDVQAYDAELAALAGLTSAADKVPYFTGSGTAALADFSSFGRSWLATTSATAGFDALSPTTTRGDIIVRGASANQRLAIGSAGMLLGSDGTDIYWRYAATLNVLDFIPKAEHAAILNRTTTTDLTAYIALAVSLLPSYGGIIDFPPGKYISDLIRTPALGKRVWFRGAGPGVTILQPLSSNTPVFAGVSSLAVSPPYVDSHRHTGFTLRAHASGSTGAAVNMDKWSFSELAFIEFEANGSGKWAYGFDLDSTDHCYSNKISFVTIKNTSPISTAVVRGVGTANHHTLSFFTLVGTSMSAVVSLANGAGMYGWHYKSWHVEGISGLSGVAMDLKDGNFAQHFSDCWFEDTGDTFSNASTTTGSVVKCVFSGANVQGVAMPTGFGRRDCTIPSDSADVSDYVPGTLTLSGPLQLAAGFGVNFGFGDVGIAHFTNALSFTGATNGYSFQDGPITAPNANILKGGRLGTGFSINDDYSLAAWDVDAAAWVNFITLNAANTPTCDLADAVTKAGGYIYRAGGTTVPVADGGTGDTGTAWSAWTPTVTYSGVAPTTVTTAARYKQLGKTIWFTIDYTVNTLGSGSGAIVNFTLPGDQTLARNFALSGFNFSDGIAAGAWASTSDGKLSIVVVTLAAKRWFLSGTIEVT